MQQELPNIDIAMINDTLLRQQITQVLNFVEYQATQIAKLTKALEQASQEITRLKGQPRKPHFSSNKKSSVSVTEFLQNKTDKRKWNKKSKEGDRSIERHLSVIQTAKKQGLPVFQTLYGLITGQLSPSILIAKSV